MTSFNHPMVKVKEKGGFIMKKQISFNHPMVKVKV